MNDDYSDDEQHQNLHRHSQHLCLNVHLDDEDHAADCRHHHIVADGQRRRVLKMMKTMMITNVNVTGYWNHFYNSRVAASASAAAVEDDVNIEGHFHRCCPLVCIYVYRPRSIVSRCYSGLVDDLFVFFFYFVVVLLTVIAIGVMTMMTMMIVTMIVERHAIDENENGNGNGNLVDFFCYFYLFLFRVCRGRVLFLYGY